MPPTPDSGGNEPNLELPQLSLGFGRKNKKDKRKRRSTEAESPVGTGQPDDAESPERGGPSVGAGQPGDTRQPEGAAAEAASSTAEEPPVAEEETPRPPIAPARPAARAPSAPARRGSAPPRPAARPPARPAARPATLGIPRGETPSGETAAGSVAGHRPIVETGDEAPDEREHTAVLPVAPEAMDPEPAPRPRVDEPPDEPAQPRQPPARPLIAATIVGAVVGLLAVLLSFGADAGCDAARGTSRCSGGVGLLILVAIVAICVLAGAALLRSWRLPDPNASSFLGVGLAAVITLAAFLDQVDSPRMLLVVPVLTALTFVASLWVMMRLVEADRE